jgi:hypothetical protein
MAVKPGAPLQLDKPTTQSNSESLCAIIGTELPENRFHVSLHRLFGDEEFVCDVAVAISVYQMRRISTSRQLSGLSL